MGRKELRGNHELLGKTVSFLNIVNIIIILTNQASLTSHKAACACFIIGMNSKFCSASKATVIETKASCASGITRARQYSKDMGNRFTTPFWFDMWLLVISYDTNNHKVKQHPLIILQSLLTLLLPGFL